MEEVAGIGIGVPGPVDAAGTVYKTANLGWDTVFNIPEAFRKYLDLPVMAGNDANVAALGEMWQGGGKGYKDLVVVTLGTGVGGGRIRYVAHTPLSRWHSAMDGRGDAPVVRESRPLDDGRQ